MRRLEKVASKGIFCSYATRTGSRDHYYRRDGSKYPARSSQEKLKIRPIGLVPIGGF
jgi:hypothetical protein